MKLKQSTSLVELPKTLEAHGCKHWATNLSIIPHTLGIPTVSIINVGRTLMLVLLRKQNCCPIGYITLLSLISRPKHRLLHLWGLLYGLLPIANLAEPLLVVRHRQSTKPEKWQNRIFLFWTKSLRSHSSVIIVDFSLKIAPISCAYSWAAPFRY